MAQTPSSGPEAFAEKAGNLFARIGRHLDVFWQRVTEGLEVQVLWTQFVAEARASYSLYTREVDWAALERESGARRVFRTASALFWAMLLKLSPARRVFLLIALALGVLALATAHIEKTDGGVRTPLPGNFSFVLLALGGLVFLLALELADRVTMKRDLEIAREIQRWLVPAVPPQVPGVDIAFATRPANTVGGDYYDAFLRGPHPTDPAATRLLLVVADVAGKSVPAALLMATFQASLRSLALTPGSLPELVAGLNRYACAHSLGGRRFTTAFFAELDPTTRALTYIGAGHNAPVLRRTSGRLERLEASSLPLGIDAQVRYECGTATLEAGDLLVIFTDGLVDAVNAKDEDYSESRLLEALRPASDASAEQTLKSLMAAVDAFVGATRQHDDITCLILRVG
jgi:sigma-B regulation protein RsbU (phosphoserine phosphatase)